MKNRIMVWGDLQTILHGLTTKATSCSIGGDANVRTDLDIESMNSHTTAWHWVLDNNGGCV
jgi:hypothetical protein